MAIKAGNIIHVGNDTVVIDRIQTAGPGNLNIPTEKIYELGNYQSVATIRDIPDLSFSMDSFDVSTEIEALMTDSDPDDVIDLATAVPIDLTSQFKAGITATSPYAVISSVALPFLYLESMSYRFGYRDNATQTATLRGDSIFYNPGPAYVQAVAGTGSSGQTVVTTNPAFMYNGDGNPRRILSVTVGSQRLTKDVDYTETYGSVSGGAAVTTVHMTNTIASTDTIRIVYASPTAKSYLQAVHEDATVKPAAVRGKDISVYVGGYDPLDIPGSAVNKMTGVQSVNVDWRVTLDKDEEFGNYYAVGQDFDVPTVNGSIDFKPVNPADLMTKIRTITGVSTTTEVLGAQSSTPLEFDVVIHEPGTSNVVKRLHVPDARFTIPGYSGRVQQKLTVTFNFESDGGTLEVSNDS